MAFEIIFNLNKWLNISSVRNNVQFTFIICKYDELFDKSFSKFSFDSENCIRTLNDFCSSNSHSEIIKSSLSLLKYSLVFLINFLGKKAEKEFLVMRLTSKIKLIAIPLHLCNSPFMTLRLYLVGHWRPMISHPRPMISVFKKFLNSFSLVSS